MKDRTHQKTGKFIQMAKDLEIGQEFKVPIYDPYAKFVAGILNQKLKPKRFRSCRRFDNYIIWREE